ncbi:MAG: DUF4838 domain-containing protein [Armatimonadota bacterium]
MSDSIRLQQAPKLEPAAQTAVSVLAAFIRRQNGGKVERTQTLSNPNMLVVGEAPATMPAGLATVEHDGYVIQPAGDGMILAAHNAKGLLNAVYGYLAWHGVLWPAPGEEVLPAKGALRFPAAPIIRTPAFSRRGIFHSQNPAEWEIWCEWYARLGFNEISLHAKEDNWKAMLQFARRYGIVMQLGGHGLSQLLPRDLFKEHPDYYRELQPPDFDKTRLPDSNLCSGSPEALAIVRKGAESYARRFPNATAYHLWADDLPAGGWCCCSRCMGYPPQDQAILANNAVAEGVVKANPTAKTAHLIYHDTIDPPRMAKPHPALAPLYAPRERCYGHAIDDPNCARNRDYREKLEQVLDYFGRPEWLLFEYYSDYILFRAMLPLMPEVVAADLKYYRAQGLDCAQHLLVATVVGLLLNLHVFAHQVWDLDADPWEPLRKLAAGVPGLLDAWKLQAQASYRWLDISDFPLDRCLDYRFLIERPAAESDAYSDACRQAADELDAALGKLPAKLPAWAKREKLSLATSAGICRQMETQMTMLGALGQCAGGENRWPEAKAAYRETLKRGKAVARLFQRAGMPDAYFLGLERLMESIWTEKITAEPKRRVVRKKV